MVPGYPDDPEVQVVAVAYDMVTSEEETPALRTQSILDPQFIHPVCAMAADRIFADMIADAELNPNGTIERRNGRLRAHALGDDVIIRNLSGLALVGASVGCIVAHQVVRCLDVLLSELGIGSSVRDAARQSCFIINLGPTTTLPVDGRVNMLSIINRNDEFVFTGNDVAGIIEAADVSQRCVVPDPGRDGSPSDHRFSVVLDVPGSITRSGDAWVFDPLGTHFGHSLKHYANGLRQMGFGSVVGRALKGQGPFVMADLLRESDRACDLSVAMTVR